MDSNRKWYQKRVWRLYLVSFVIFSCFFCHLLSNNKRNIAELMNLKEDLEVLSIALKRQIKNSRERSGNIENTALDIPGASDSSLSGCNCHSRRLNSYVDSIIKQTLSSFMVDIYNITHKTIDWP